MLFMKKLLGYVDCVSNGVTDAYIQDLMVHPEYQGKGVGTELMNQMFCGQMVTFTVVKIF